MLTLEPATEEERPGRWRQCLLSLLCGYVGLNLLLINAVPLLNECALTVVVVDERTGEAQRGVEVRSLGRSEGGAPPNSTSCVAALASPSGSPSSRATVTDSGGSCSLVTVVQDQGWWVLPRLGVRANLSGSELELTTREGKAYRVSVPRYEGPQGELRVFLPSLPRPLEPGSRR